MDELLQRLTNQLPNLKVERHKDISNFLTLRTKTYAEAYIEAQSREDLIQIVKFTHEHTVPFLLLGGGSNIAVTKDVISGIVVKNFYMRTEIVEDKPEYSDLLYSSGYPISRVVLETVRQGLSGFEYQLGLPGTVGGALYMNSKWTKPVSYCGDSLLFANTISLKGVEYKRDRNYFQFGYDYSIIQKTKEVVLEAVFRLKKKDKDLLKRHSDEALAYRKKTQPFGVATSGCFFQNITPQDSRDDPEASAGYYIDQAGLKNTKIGNFIVSDKHANFIINQGEGKPEDLLKLIKIIKETVSVKFGVQLKEEVLII